MADRANEGFLKSEEGKLFVGIGVSLLVIGALGLLI